jgi:hypothetical protein
MYFSLVSQTAVEPNCFKILLKHFVIRKMTAQDCSLTFIIDFLERHGPFIRVLPYEHPDIVICMHNMYVGMLFMGFCKNQNSYSNAYMVYHIKFSNCHFVEFT